MDGDREKARALTGAGHAGVCADGHREVLDLSLVGVESADAWLDAAHSLGARNLGVPLLAVVDGNPGLAAALVSAFFHCCVGT